MRIKDARNGVINRGTRTAQACGEKHLRQENENPYGSAGNRSPIRLAHRLANSHQAFSPGTSPETSGAQPLVAAVVIEDQGCLRLQPRNAVSNQLRDEAKPQAVLIERFCGR